ncbi:hypothetical protein E9993_05385 [Labilibacter sediminis]|nr:hypothetical protein E9993_05385 [Labilibacter sediminis]
MNTLKAYWRTLLLIAIILFLSLMNINKVIPDEVHLHRHFDKFAHFMMYFALSFVFFIENYRNKNSLRKFWIIFDTIALGIAVEFLQYLITTNRTANIYDALFNTLGVIVGSILYLLLKDNQFIYKLMLFKAPYNK